MDKLENETWEEYAFRNDLFKIKYADKENTVIEDINIPDHTRLRSRHCEPLTYVGTVNGYGIHAKASFLDFIMRDLYCLSLKYNLKFNKKCYSTPIPMIINMTKEREEDMNRQKWLFKQLDYWDKKNEENKRYEHIKNINATREKNAKAENAKERYLALKSIIAETHQAQLDELLTLLIEYPQPPPNLEKAYNTYDEYLKDKITKTIEEESNKIKKERIERIELYEKYLKNKDIRNQIIELEQKLNQLKCQIVK